MRALRLTVWQNHCRTLISPIESNPWVTNAPNTKTRPKQKKHNQLFFLFFFLNNKLKPKALKTNESFPKPLFHGHYYRFKEQILERWNEVTRREVSVFYYFESGTRCSRVVSSYKNKTPLLLLLLTLFIFGCNKLRTFYLTVVNKTKSLLTPPRRFVFIDCVCPFSYFRGSAFCFK